MKKFKKIYLFVLLSLALSNLQAGKKQFVFNYRGATRKEQKQFSRSMRKQIRKIDKKRENLPKEIRVLENLQLKGIGRISLPKLNLNKKQTLTMLILFMLVFAQVSANIDYIEESNKWPDSVKLIEQKKFDEIKGYKFCSNIKTGYKNSLDICAVITKDYNVKLCATKPIRCVDINFKKGIDGGLERKIDKYRGFAPFSYNRVAPEVYKLDWGQKSDFENKAISIETEDKRLSLYEINEDDMPTLHKTIEEIKNFVGLDNTNSTDNTSFWLAEKANGKPLYGSFVLSRWIGNKCHNDVIFSIEDLTMARDEYYFPFVAGHEIAHLLQSCCCGQDLIDDNNEMIVDIVADMFVLFHKKRDIVSGLVTTTNYDTFFKIIEPEYEIFLDDPYAYSDELDQCGHNHPSYVTRSLVRLIIRAQSIKAIKLLSDTQIKYLKFYKDIEDIKDSYIEDEYIFRDEL